MSVLVAIHVPPTAATHSSGTGCAGRLPRLTPPVGTEAHAEVAVRPGQRLEHGGAAADFRRGELEDRAAQGHRLLGFARRAHAGMIGRPRTSAFSTRCGFRPGATANSPAFGHRADSSPSRSFRVPGLGRLANPSMASAAASVRNVISISGRPPSIRASASGRAASAESITITGTTPVCAMS